MYSGFVGNLAARYCVDYSIYLIVHPFMSLSIHFYGDPILRTPAAPIKSVTPDILKLADEMIATMRVAEGVGLAAQQVGQALAICVVEVPVSYDTDEDGIRLNPELEMPLVLLNPVITGFSKKTDVHEEGCLSFPGIRGNIERPLDITLRYLDLQGKAHEIQVYDFTARVVQHEVDHLNGVLFIDHMSVPKRMVLKKRLQRMKEETEEKLGIQG